MGIGSLQPVDFSSMLTAPDPGAALTEGYQTSLARNLAQAQLARQLQQQRQGDAALNAAILHPTPQNFATALLRNPQLTEQIKTSHGMLDDDQKGQALRDQSSVYGYLQAGNTDAAKAVLQRRRDADAKAGQDTSDDDAVLAQIDKDPTKALGVVGMNLHAVLGPDKFIEAFGKFGSEARANAEEPGKLAELATKPALVAAQTAEATANAAKTTQETANLKNPRHDWQAVPGAFNPDGSPVLFDKNAVTQPSGGATGVPPALDSFVSALIPTEGVAGRPDAKNPLSSAMGDGQFLKGTWIPLLKATHPELTNGKTDAEILALRANPKLSREMVGVNAQQNAEVLKNSKLPVNGTTLAMAHKLGVGGAQAVLQADPATPLPAILSKDTITANPQLKNLTAGQYANGLKSKFGVSEIDTTPGDPNATGEEYLKTLSPGLARQVKAIANGDLSLPTGRQAATGRGQLLTQQVLQYDPTASAVILPTRQATRIAFTKGIQGQALNSGNTVAGHLGGLDHAIDQLSNTGFDWVNGPAQSLGRHFGNKATQKAVADFNFYKVAVANELTKVFRGSNGAEADIQGWLKQLDSAKSPTELHATVRAMANGIQSRLEALKSEYANGMGRNVNMLELVTPHALATFQKLLGGSTDLIPSDKSIAYLTQHPEAAAQFDARYGPGASTRFVGGQ